MPVITAQQVFKDLEKGETHPFYLVVGEEPFQMGEFCARFKTHFVKEDTENTFNFEVWDGEGLHGQELLSSLQTLPGLFGGEGEKKLILCHRFEKANSGALEIVQPYFADPNPETVFVMTAAKPDKRKSWYKEVSKRGPVIEVEEPSDRDWPKWQGFFEKKIGKKIDLGAWQLFVEASGRMLSILIRELEKAAIFVGTRNQITLEDAHTLLSASATADVFSFAEDVVMKKKFAAMRKFETLKRGGESEIKLLAILVRQFRMVDKCLHLSKLGISDPKIVGPKIGSHPFFVAKVQAQTKGHTTESLEGAIHLLADSDFKMKTGQGGLFDTFLSRYF